MMFYKSLTGTVLFLCLLCVSSEAFDTLRVTAALDTSRHRIKGLVEYRIPDDCNLTTVEFQLFANIYSSKDTPFMKSRPDLADYLSRMHRWGQIAIDSAFINNANVGDNLEINLTTAVIAGGEFESFDGKTVRLYFTTTIPELGYKLSYIDQEYLLSGWFPTPAIRRDCKWYNPDYGAFAELTGDFHIFDISFSVPENLIVVSPVPPVETVTQDGIVTRRYTFGPAHEFAMALSPEYQEDSVNVGGTILKYYYRSYEKVIVNRIRPTVKTAFEYMNDNVGPYAYPYLNITLVTSPVMDGFEFPAVAALFSPRGGVMASNMYEATAVRTIVNQWFYGVVASDQTRIPWLNRSVAGFFAKEIIELIWGDDTGVFEFAGLELSYEDYLRATARFSAGKGIVNRPADSFGSKAEYTSTIDACGVLVLETFDNMLGDSLSVVFWRKYFERNRFRYADYEEFVSLADEVGGADISDALTTLLNNPTEIDYSVISLSNARADSVSYEVTFKLERTGLPDWPVKYRLILHNGDTLDFDWNPEYHSEIITKVLPSPVSKVIIDPDRVISVDSDLINNSILADTDSRPALRISSGMIFLIESLLSNLGGW